MVDIINKFGVNWRIITAKTNELYIIENESFYNTCKKWFMLVQDKNNITQYLAYHNTKTEKNIIANHIKTSKYLSVSEQKLYEIDNIELNKDGNMSAKYDTIFTNKNLYAIPDNHIDIIEKIDPSLGKYIDRFKNDNITDCTVNNDLLRKIIIQYNHYRKSQFWTEQYKYDYFEQHNHIFDNLDNLEEKIKNLGSPNFVPFMWKTSVFRYLCEFHLSEFKNILVELFNEKEDLISRINLFLKTIKEILIHSPNWKSKDRINVGVESASFFLALKDPTKYLLYTRINPYNTFSKNLNINITTKNEDKYVQWIKYCNDILRPEMNKFLGFENNLLDCQDLIWWYHNVAQKNNSEDIAMDNNLKEQSLNQILYGPPGTGKTYNTVIKAIEITNPELIQKDKDGNIENYELLKEKFDELKQQGQIEFVTFHQSYSYEEFVEGIKPDLENGKELRYKLQNGIFKTICNNAKELLETKVKYNFNKDNISVYKILIPDESLFAYCIENDCVAINWGNDIDISNCDSQEEIIAKIPEDFESRKQCISQLNLFKLWIDNDLKNGKDVIVVIPGSMNTIKGIAKITGDYFYNSDIENGHQQRKVDWIRKNINISSDSIYNSKFVSPTITGMFNDKINWDTFLNLINNKNNSKSSNAVLVIDEINRGDVSKIFGELITLIEEDKRIGEKHQMTVTLPYSRETFGVPKNLYIIGTMNTADRSIALLDTALRRRFDFEEMMPKPELLRGKDIEGVDLEQLLTKINDRIKNEYDRDHQIGHSYLMDVKNKEQLEKAYKNRILPLLNEYFYNDIDSVAKILNCRPNDISSKENWFNILKEAQKPTKKDNEQ